jgi:hypothetical protein
MPERRSHLISYLAVIVSAYSFYHAYAEEIPLSTERLTLTCFLFGICLIGVGRLESLVHWRKWGEPVTPRLGMMFLAAVPICFAFVNLMAFGAGLAQGAILNTSQTVLLAFLLAAFFWVFFAASEVLVNIIWHEI